MVTIEPELRGPAPRPTRLRPGARLRFSIALALFLLMGGAPLFHVARQVWAFQLLQRDGEPVRATVRRQVEEPLLPGVRLYQLECAYDAPSGRPEVATVTVSQGWWRASPPGSGVTITVCDAMPGAAAPGGPSDLQLGDELGMAGYGTLLLGLVSLLLFGACLRPYFRDLALVSLGTPVSGRVVGRTWRVVRRLGWNVTLPMIHLHFQDPFGVERVRTQVVDAGTWARVAEGESMTVLVCARRRGWFAAYPLLLAEAAPLQGVTPITFGSGRLL